MSRRALPLPDRARAAERPPIEPGSVRHTLIELLGSAAVGELLLGLVGGLPAAGTGAVLFTVAGLVTARYVGGGGSEDSTLRRRTRLLAGREPGLGDWYWTIRNGLEEDGYLHPLRPQLQRLYAARLSETHGVSLFTEPARAAALVGPELWPWLDPGRPAPRNTVPPEVLAALTDRLDEL
ncbi:hypothetical protein ACIGXM_19530 [Kitasatospora sp. NPDC052896]|uniref:hypothetical protein n=1 Tax=Kitasatospora sp. NPDC052896 TaxID=3364061 RepID=UPI0037C98069